MAMMAEDIQELIRCAEDARAAIERKEWGMALQMLNEAQERIGRLLQEVGEKEREVLIVPQPDKGDRG